MQSISEDIKNTFNVLSDKLQGDFYYDKFSRILWSTDASIYQIIPLAVHTPFDEQDVINTIKFCWVNNIPIHPRGAGSGLGGASIGEGIIIDFTKYMDKIIDVNAEEKQFVVQPGCRLSNIQKELAEHELFLPPDPSSADYSAIGGNIATNAGGAHSVKYGLMSDYTISLTVILSNGERIVTRSYNLNDPNYINLKKKNTLEAAIYKGVEKICLENNDLIQNGYPRVKYNVTGYELRNIVKNDKINLTRLFIGSEGSLGTVTEITMRVISKPKYNVLMVAYFSDAEKMGKATWEALQENPSAVEVMDHTLLDIAKEAYPDLKRKLPIDLNYMLLIEFDGENQFEVEAQATAVNERILKSNHLAFHSEIATKDEDKNRLWEVRKTGLPLLGKLNYDGRKSTPVIEDAAVPPESLPDYMKELYYLSTTHKIKMAIYGHAGKGLLHTRPFLNLQNKNDIETMAKISQSVFEKVNELKGTISGEHGDGRVRGQYIRKQYGNDMYNLFLKIKKSFDPKDIMNPGIKVTEKEINLTDNLRYGENYQKTIDFNKGLVIHFQQAEWENEIEMCHGCSKCTTILTTVNMCPIYKGKQTETASPKAKANALRAIISGKIGKNESLKSSVMKEIIFNCTGCQSCVIECPSNVNIPKIALEFKAQFVEKNGQPLGEYLLGSLGTFGKILGPISFITNWFMNTQFSRWMAEKTVGMTRYRTMPNFKRKSFKTWFDRNYLFNTPMRRQHSKKVVYFSGCSANYVNPEIGKSMVEVLMENNIEVIVPKQKCCGLPMYTYGNVKRGKKYAQYSIDQFLPYVKQGYDILVTCSSCGLSLKQEWHDLLGSDDALEIANSTYHFSEYLLLLREEGLLNENFGDVDLMLGYHTPCHLKVQKTSNSASTDLLQLIPKLQVKGINEGCCGICGSWGYKKENYEVSMKIGTGLLNELKSYEKGVTDCPTCKLQMEHGSNKDVLHPVEILAMSYKNQ